MLGTPETLTPNASNISVTATDVATTISSPLPTATVLSSLLSELQLTNPKVIIPAAIIDLILLYFIIYNLPTTSFQ